MFRMFYRATLLLVITSSFIASASDKAKVAFERHCAQCHGKDGGGMRSIAAPAISGLPDWYAERQLRNFRSGVRGTHPLDVAGTRMAPMARFFRNEEDLVAMAQYVSKMPAVKQERTVVGSVVKGEARFQVCAACHGAGGEGMQATNAPTLAGASDWYLLTQLKNFKSGARAGDPARDPIGAAMAANAALLDEEAMKDLVSYINTFSAKP